MAQEEQEHPLHEYLTTHLPPLGLDAETYLPYVTGYFEARQDDVTITTTGSTTGSKSTMMETDEDFDQVMELLQASSETHAEDDAIWQELSITIRTLYQTHLCNLESKRQVVLEEQRMADTRKQLEEIELAKQNQVEMEKKKELLKEQEVVMDASKRALLEQYGYEDQLYDDEGNVIVQEESSGGGGSKGKKKGETAGAASSSSSSSDVPSNKAYAQQINKERALDSRSKQGSTKTEERQKSKSAKLDKIKKKEERRNRAQKGERKR